MAQMFNNKYRIPSARLQNWNYANEVMYFVTICTKNRENYFGEIVDYQCITNLLPAEIGKIAHSEWYKSIEMRPDMNLEFGEFVVMPNHIHGIVMIGANEYNTITYARRDAMHCVSTNANTNDTEYKNKFAPQSKNLSSIIRGYKSAVTTYARKNGIEFDWQPRFHDHIIRSMDDYHKISNYIIDNPDRWQEDKFYNTPTVETQCIASLQPQTPKKLIMTPDNKIVLDKTINIENQNTPFGKRYGGDVFIITDEDIENLKNGKLIALDVMNEYITYLKFKAK